MTDNTQNSRQGSKSELDDLLSAMAFPATLDEAIERAAKHLPKDWVLNINIEKNGYGLVLESPDCDELTDIDGGDGLRSDIHKAICIANGVSG